MKEIINKLFEKFGYIPKSKYDKYDWYIDEYDLKIKLDMDIHEQRAEYSIIDNISSFWVVAHNKVGIGIRLVKSFNCIPYEDREYAFICAKELCDMLNAKY
jgi:hypothetical protein